MDIDSTLAELKGRHESLTAAYKDAKVNGSRKAHAEAKAALIAFRAQYGKVIAALDEVTATGAVEV